MDLSPFFRSMAEQDTSAVVMCDTEHTVVYMNPAAVLQYAKRGGVALIGKSLLDCHNKRSNELINRVVDWFKADKSHNIIHTFYNEKQNKDVYMVALRDGQGKLIGYYEKHEYRTRDTEPCYNFQ